ncbi:MULTISPECIES: serine aminopeptidase domain-containing protein [Nostocales]|uniref:Alpha/beta hydrolase n=3 Tax=Nostocales TaxID=1161 RepID=A0A8S9SWV7_9CYAN|nr:alpha/beta hydrolase [Tolypothrix bouteillei]KAF3884565.1 alpha/beta hydrolase [Tolypothrix bouteillei VB521301]
MTRKRLFLIAAALLLIISSWWGVVAARTGLVMRRFEVEGVPMLYVAPKDANKIPGVLIAHGYAGSKQLMLAYAHVMARAGYAAMLWDFNSHGANANPLERDSLQQNLNTALATFVKQPEVDSSRLALLGHSMGSGAVMSVGIQDVNRFAATIAVSPTGANVTPSAPRNLQLQAGSWEGRFVTNARRLLKAAGGENQNLTDGRGRSLAIVPNAEHITILFRDPSHQAAKNWLDSTFGVQRSSDYVDRRILWYGLHLLGWLVLLDAVVPLLLGVSQEKLGFESLSPNLSKLEVNQLRSWGGLLIAPFVASGVLTLLSRNGDIDSLGGLLVGGAVSIWFGVAGLVWLLVIFRLPRPTLQAVGIGVALFAVLWIAFGAIAQFVWLQWWLIPARLKLFPLLSIACLPWFLASGIAQHSIGIGKRVLWWLGQSMVLVGGFILVLYLLPQLGFIALLLPLFPLVMAIFSFTANIFQESWSYAIGSAFLFGWMLAAAFPLAS